MDGFHPHIKRVEKEREMDESLGWRWYIVVVVVISYDIRWFCVGRSVVGGGRGGVGACV
jgi:hypothetical protein